MGDRRDSNEMNLDDDEFRDMVKRWVRDEVLEGRLPPKWLDDALLSRHDTPEEDDG